MSANQLPQDPPPNFNIVEATIAQHKEALFTGTVTAVDLVISYLHRIATYDTLGGLNAFTLINPNVLAEAEASDARRAVGLPPRPLEGIPYTIKDSYKVAGLTVTNGSPALKGLRSNEDSGIAKQLRDAGAVLLGKTNMPPMAAGGMQRGLYGRSESPYNERYLAAAFSSGSSSGAAVSVACSMGVFGIGSETVSSGRSPASNNALVAYTPSKGVLSCRGLWPLYVTCDVPVPLARSVEDMLAVLDVLSIPDPDNRGDFWREQNVVKLGIPGKKQPEYGAFAKRDALRRKRVGVPKMYVGGQDDDPHAKPTFVSADVIALWKNAATVLEALGAELVYTDFPLVTNYENDSVSGETNNVAGAPADWNTVERSTLIAKAWSQFLTDNGDAKIKRLADVEPQMLFPKPEAYLPDTWLEVRNWVHYAALPSLEAEFQDVATTQFPGLEQVLPALEAQRKRDLEDWMAKLGLDSVVFPSQGDVGLADLEFDLESARHSLKNGVKYANGNRALRHLGVPTVSVPMGVMRGSRMPVNLTFAGKAYEDEVLLGYAYAFEQESRARVVPPLTPQLESDFIVSHHQVLSKEQRAVLELTADVVKGAGSDQGDVHVRVGLGRTGAAVDPVTLEVWVNGSEVWKRTLSGSEVGQQQTITIQKESAALRPKSEALGWDLKPLEPRSAMLIVVAKAANASTKAKLLWV